MSIAPERVWLEDEFGDDDPDQWGYGTWDIRNMDGYVHEYIRADIHAAALARETGLREALQTLAHIHDRNPSAACADMPSLHYARYMLSEARCIARESLDAKP